MTKYHSSLMLPIAIWKACGGLVLWGFGGWGFFFLQSQAKYINKFFDPQTFIPQDYLALLGAQAMHESSHNSSRGPETKKE